MVKVLGQGIYNPRVALPLKILIPYTGTFSCGSRRYSLKQAMGNTKNGIKQQYVSPAAGESLPSI